MELGSGVVADYKDGKVVISAFDGGVELTVKAAALIKPVLDGLEDQISSGKIDPVEGTDLDKEALLSLIAGLKKAVGV